MSNLMSYRFLKLYQPMCSRFLRRAFSKLSWSSKSLQLKSKGSVSTLQKGLSSRQTHRSTSHLTSDASKNTGQGLGSAAGVASALSLQLEWLLSSPIRPETSARSRILVGEDLYSNDKWCLQLRRCWRIGTWFFPFNENVFVFSSD